MGYVEKKALQALKPVVDAQDKTNKILFGVAAAGVVLGLGGCTAVARVNNLESDMEDVKKHLGKVTNQVKKNAKVTVAKINHAENVAASATKKASKAMEIAKTAKRTVRSINQNLQEFDDGSFRAGDVGYKIHPIKSPRNPFAYDGDDYDDADEDETLFAPDGAIFPGVSPAEFDEDYEEDDVDDEDEDDDDGLVVNPLLDLSESFK